MQLLHHVANDLSHEYQHQVPITVNSVTATALVDSGNLWRNVINPTFLAALGLSHKDLRPIPGLNTIGTAKKGAQLAVLGELKNSVYIRVGNHPRTFPDRPVVLQGLAMDFNMSGPFLKRHNIDQLHSEGALHIDGQKVPLTSAKAGDVHAIGQPHGDEGSAVYVIQGQRVPPLSVMYVTAKVLQVETGRMPPGDQIVSGDVQFRQRTGLQPWRSALIAVPHNGIVHIGVLNPMPTAVTIPAGCRYGWTEEKAISNHLITTMAARAPGKSEPSRTTKIQRVMEAFAESWADMLQDQAQQSRAIALLVKYYDTFSWDGSYGTTDLIQHAIHVKPHTRPINCRYRPPNPALEQSLKEQVNKWLREGVVEQSQSPWNFALVAAPKKNGKIRWCVDFRRLNDATIKDAHPIGHIEDNLVRLSHSKVFSTIDGAGAYHVVEMRPQDKELTAFATPWGSFQFRKLPFGLCNAPSTYARLVNMVMAGIPYEVALPYLDDTVIHSRTVNDHYDALERVLRAHQDAGLRLQPTKCHFFQAKVEYLGHLVSGKGIGPIPAYTRIVQDWPVPTNRTEVRAFLGKTGYYRRFIKNYAAIAGPLLDQLRAQNRSDKETFPKTKAMQDSVDHLKHALTHAPILAYPDFSPGAAPFILDTDWSYDNNAIGAVLSQVQQGHERVLAYGAKRLTASQRNYASTKGELAAVIIFMRHWKYYLQHTPFVLRVDNRALQWINTMEAPTGMIQRWLDTLANYNFTVQHRQGKAHGNADGLSRAPHIPAADQSVDIANGERIAQIGWHTQLWQQSYQKQQLLAMGPPGPDNAETRPWSVKEWKHAQVNDEDLSLIIKWLETQHQPTMAETQAMGPTGRTYCAQWPQLALNQAGLVTYHKPQLPDAAGPPRQLLVVPKDWWTLALKKAHVAGAHLAAKNTVERAQHFVYFPGMLRHAEVAVAACQQCQTAAGKQPAQKALLHSHLEGYPFQKLSLDFVGPLPTSKKGNQYILTVLDTFTKWLEAFPVRRANADTVVRMLTEHIFPRFGLCETIHSDRGTQFTSDLLHEVASALGIKLTTTPAYNPKSNPVERYHRTLEKAITAVVGKDVRMWEAALPHVLFAMRTTVSATTKLAPYQLLFGREPSTPLELLFGAPKPRAEAYTDQQQYALALQQRVMTAQAYARKNMAEAVRRQRRQYTAQHRSFLPGQKVWLFTPRLKLGQSKKFATYWTGPWSIKDKINELMYHIRPDPTWTRKRDELVSIDRLRLYTEDDTTTNTTPPGPEDDLTMIGDESAENVSLPGNNDDDDDDIDWPHQFLPVPQPQQQLPQQHVQPQQHGQQESQPSGSQQQNYPPAAKKPRSHIRMRPYRQHQPQPQPQIAPPKPSAAVRRLQQEAEAFAQQFHRATGNTATERDLRHSRRAHPSGPGDWTLGEGGQQQQRQMTQDETDQEVTLQPQARAADYDWDYDPHVSDID